MKTNIIFRLVITALLIQTTAMASGKTEEQKYTVVSSNEDFEIRFYPSATLATVYSTANSYKEVSGPGFRALAGYIFGGNEAGKQISMTSPVHMNITAERSAMSFVMPCGLQSRQSSKARQLEGYHREDERGVCCRD
jgi:hypothetical protein